MEGGAAKPHGPQGLTSGRPGEEERRGPEGSQQPRQVGIGTHPVPPADGGEGHSEPYRARAGGCGLAAAFLSTADIRGLRSPNMVAISSAVLPAWFSATVPAP